jgi:hypothetical protein
MVFDVTRRVPNVKIRASVIPKTVPVYVLKDFMVKHVINVSSGDYVIEM